MGWIKRNLFFVVGGIIALGLLGAAAFYAYQGWSHNSASAEKLNEIYGSLQTLANAPVKPGNDKVDNTQTAKDQEAQINAWIQSSGNYFQPIPPIPSGVATSEIFAASFASALRQTIAELQREAADDGVTLPPQYNFSFKAQNGLLSFAPGSLGPLATQLGEVKAISEIIFSTGANALDGIQRVRVSSDDTAGPQSDYTDDQPMTNSLVTMTPYIITFRSFTPELSRVIAAFADSTNAFIIKAINVQPASAAGTAMPDNYNPNNPFPGQPMQRYGEPGGMPSGIPQTVPNQGGGLPTILKEQLLRITLEVELVKLLPKS